MTETALRPERRDVYQRVTDQIIAAIEAGAGDVEMPWHRDVSRTAPSNAFTGQAYRGVNILALWAAAEANGFATGLWATYKQWKLLDAQVRKRAKGSVVVFYKQTECEVTNAETGCAGTRTFRFASASYVFNADQVDGWQPRKPVIRDPAEVVEEAEAFVAATRADIRHGGDSASYRPTTDHIQMPERCRFTGTKTSSATESYYATLLHELTHWTGHKRRVNRDLAKRFGDNAYAMEELVAELGAAFLCSELGITNAPRPDHAAYIANWLEVLKNDTRAIFTAASKASEAKGYLVRLQQRSHVVGEENRDEHRLRNPKEASQ